MSNTNDWLNSMIEKNAWSIVLAILASGVVYATMQSRISAHAQEIDRLDTKVTELQKLVERVIVLEEHDKNFSEDLGEIKQDLKDIKGAVGAE